MVNQNVCVSLFSNYRPMRKKGSGGSRKNAGRKPIPDSQKKHPVLLYVEQWKIDKMEGIERIREALITFINGKTK